MTNIVLPPVTGASNLSTLNDNFRKIQESINNDVLNLGGGNNVMKQDLDMDGNDLLNVNTNPSNPNSLLTVGTGDGRYYNVTGDTLTGPMNANGQAVLNLPAAVAPSSPVRKQEFDAAIFGSASDLETRLADKVSPTKGAGMVGFSQTPNYPAGTIGAHEKAFVSVTDHPYNATVGVSATAAFQAAYDATPAGGRIIVPAPGPFSVGTVIGTKNVVWEVQYDLNTNLGLLALPGSVAGVIGTSDANYRGQGLGNQFALKRLTRLANYAGGTPGTVCSNLHVSTSVSNNAAQSFEWAGTFVLDNSGQGQNVALYGQGNRRATSAVTLGGTFAGVMEARDFTEEANPTTGLIGLEVDIFANGTDAVGRRIGIDLVVGKGVSTGAKCEALAGLRLGAVLGDTTRGRFRNAILINGDKDYGMQITGAGVENSINITATGGKAGVSVSGTNSDSDYISAGASNIGMRFSGTYASGLAIRMITGSALGLESTGAIKINFGSPNIQFLNGAAVRNSFNTSTGAISIGANQVLGPRITGWNAPTGTPARGTFDVSTATVATCAAAIAALIADFRTHGAIGT